MKRVKGAKRTPNEAVIVVFKPRARAVPRNRRRTCLEALRRRNKLPDIWSCGRDVPSVHRTMRVSKRLEVEPTTMRTIERHRLCQPNQ
jgi:hypothetical protein